MQNRSVGSFCFRFIPEVVVFDCLVGLTCEILRLVPLPSFECKLSFSSMRADEIKLWVTPSAKQRRNPCSGVPAVYPDLSTRHD